ncbi:MAG: GNAT family N-acetyltransferase [Candidatus Nanopelagicales bacterium]|nr:GNAT family N-acetyltransferase [Candidatus Nanopelagicales bacterium]
MDFIVEPFHRRFDRRAFDSGQPALDEWLRSQAGQQDCRHNARTFLAVLDNRVIGYYSTLTYRLDLDEVAAAVGAGARQYPIPAVLLARLAVDREFQGHGVGSRLLLDGLARLASVSRDIGFEVVVVDALDQDASVFYRRFGFRAFQRKPLKLFLATKDLRRTFGLA